MSRWLNRELVDTPLGEIDDELAELGKKAKRDLSVADVERMADLREARRRIVGPGRRIG